MRLAALALVLCCLPGCAALNTSSQAASNADVESYQNRRLQSEINTMRLALEQFSTDNQGHYPTPVGCQAGLCTNHYMPGNKLPDTPWGAPGQPLRLVGTERAQAAFALSAPRLPTLDQLGDAGLQPGTVLYHLDSKTQAFELIGIGQRDGHPTVAAACTNVDVSDTKGP